MQLKHEWNEEQQKIIAAVKRQFKKRKFNTTKEIILAVQHVLMKRNIPFYEAWDEIPKNIKESYHFNQVWFYIFLQACSAVFTEHSGNDDMQKILCDIPDYFNKKFQNLPQTEKPVKLPVRLPDPELYAAAQNGDLAKIIMLYDMAKTPGQKMKNIYHLLFNNRSFGCAFALHERYGGIENIAPEIMKQHFFYEDPDESDHADTDSFYRFYCQNHGKKYPRFWVDANQYRILDRVIRPALESGIDPDQYVFDSDIQIPLRKYLYFIDEIYEPFMKLYPWQYGHWSDSRWKKYANSILNAAKIFTEWEKENTHD